MKRKQAKQINKNILVAGLITEEVFSFIEQEIELQLEEELQEEKSRVRDQIDELFDNNYALASSFFKQSLELSY